MRDLALRQNVKSSDLLFVSHGDRGEGQRLTTRKVRSRISDVMQKAGITHNGISPKSLTWTVSLLWLNSGMDLHGIRQRVSEDILRLRIALSTARGLPHRGAYNLVPSVNWCSPAKDQELKA